ncbi:MAG: hypothetical protein A3B86_03830 [Candidatus Yanofskybacteria bacterium RIFCSPHIGHO2_02_FULL_38_22b]|uniref:Uncharacterized protein n=1 Tax=Candidatus Yanofskybacteria bacterium RIFCSPHIGHO2_02_FULL_38_22b TaxID=1802673 RepID=A0A1F8EZC5_9BACT|nr:MAG: hypothetical protein A2816_01595 [Candidatus Yanofskybacteria bacterium RIFCSPHIGHO2_01_FULL_39_44]OGN06222.1 MAG: hypothetical protein A3B86_03830 [Candidatus Yanofskybacteria bacterium RIFCSPHIGHO2_02_FULL_38_22b]OGN19641.1 MAG: hypothetical protein A2910_03560 [Candidatus Yanofskybacteria bacterium RIFCSPLOWO2_01_FULL_39_28]
MTGAHAYMLAENRINAVLAQYDALPTTERDKIGRAAYKEKLWRREVLAERLALSGFMWGIAFVALFYFSGVIRF